MKKNDSRRRQSLDLSYAYGTQTLEKLRENGLGAPDAEQDAETCGDTTIRAITSFFSGTRELLSFEDAAAGQEPEDCEEPAAGPVDR